MAFFGPTDGVAAVAAGLIIGGTYRYIAFLDIPAFGLATYALWQNLSHREDMQIAKKRLAASDRRREQIENRDIDLIERAKEMAALVNFTTLAEVREVMIARDNAKRALADAQAVYDAAENDPELIRLREESDTLGRQIRQRELELSTDHSGLMLLPKELEVGTPLNDVFPIGDHVLDLEVTGNRPDCLGMLGVAVEAGTAMGEDLTDMSPTDVKPHVIALS